MSDDESRREDARQEAAIDRALRHGTMGYCWFCDGLTSNRAPEDDEYFDRWICKPCHHKLIDEPTPEVTLWDEATGYHPGSLSDPRD